MVKVPVSTRALVQRIARRAADGKTFHVMREGTPYRGIVGRYFSVDDRNRICSPGGNNLENIPRDVDVLKPWEELASERRTRHRPSSREGTR